MNLNAALNAYVRTANRVNKEIELYDRISDNMNRAHERQRRAKHPITLRQHKEMEYHSKSLSNQGNRTRNAMRQLSIAYSNLRSSLPRHLQVESGGPYRPNVLQWVKRLQNFRRDRQVRTALRVLETRRKRRHESAVGSAYKGITTHNVPSSLAARITRMALSNR